jgi:hypothetical protein
MYNKGSPAPTSEPSTKQRFILTLPFLSFIIWFSQSIAGFKAEITGLLIKIAYVTAVSPYEATMLFVLKK